MVMFHLHVSMKMGVDQDPWYVAFVDQDGFKIPGMLHWSIKMGVDQMNNWLMMFLIYIKLIILVI